MHILIIPSEEFIPIQNHLAGIFQLHQAKILQDNGHKVGVISISQSLSIPMVAKACLAKLVGKKLQNELDDLSVFQVIRKGLSKHFSVQKYITWCSIQGIPVVRIQGFYYHKPKEHFNDFGWVKAGLAAYEAYAERHGKPDIIHAHNALYAGMLAYKLQHQCAVPYIITEHSTVYARGLIVDKTQLKKIKTCYQHATSLFAVSLSFCSLLNTMFSIKDFQYLPNVLDPFLEAKPYKQSESKKKVFTFLNIAELHPKKDQLTLLQAFALVNKTHPTARLVIGGSGELEMELKTYIKQNNLQQVVDCKGALTREEVYMELIKSDCFVLSSLFETFGVVIIEAMLFGKPAIVTRCGGPQSFINDTCGITVACSNAKEMAIAMEQMMNQYSTYPPEAIRKYTLENFSAKAFYNNIFPAYKNAGIHA